WGLASVDMLSIWILSSYLELNKTLRKGKGMVVLEKEAVRAPALTHLFTMRALLEAPLDSGEGPLGRRSFNRVSSGTFEGDRLRGEVISGSGDWMMTRGGIRVLDARVALRADDCALIHMAYAGRGMFPEELTPDLLDLKRRHLIDPARYYFRSLPV